VPFSHTVKETALVGRGALWDAHRRHFGQDGDPVLVWQAPTRVMNPGVDPQVIAEAYADDEAAAAQPSPITWSHACNVPSNVKLTRTERINEWPLGLP
jgi:hypothetical protein